eukprot:GHVO01021677.1.p1 GENE.GHVO01021677.1~~GHVO01021677.1.p1  ORF type:complete len:878 (+),score=133.69 GHVO01021677.1:251-2635(+)
MASADDNSDASSHGLTKLKIVNKYKSVRVHVYSAYDLYDPQFVGKMDPYVKMRVGTNELTGPVMRDAGRNPKFHSTYVFPYNNEKNMRFKVYDREHMMRDRVVGNLKVDFTNPIQHGVLEKCTQLAGPKDVDGGRILYRIEFSEDVVTEATVGELMATPPQITEKDVDSDEVPADPSKSNKGSEYKTLKLCMRDATNLYNVQYSGKQDPYCKLRLGNNELTSEVQRDAGTECDFSTAFYFPYAGERTVTLEVRDREHVGKNRMIGNAKIDLENFMTVGQHKYKVQLSNKEKNAGECNCTVEFLKEQQTEARATFIAVDGADDASSHGLAKAQNGNTNYKGMRVTVGKAEELYNPQWVGKMDPYVKVQCGLWEGQSEVMRDSGVNSVINTSYTLPYNQEKHLRLQVWDRERMRRNREVGSVKVNLEPFLSKDGTVFEQKVALQGPKGKSGGHISYRVEFLTDAITSVTVAPATAFEVAEGPTSTSRSPGSADQSGFQSVKISLKDGKGLYNPQMMGKMDPYCKLTVGANEGTSHVRKDAGVNPDFDALFIMTYDSANPIAHFQLMDREHTKRDMAVGSCSLNLTTLTGQGPHEMTLPVDAAKKGKDGGTIDVKVEFSLLKVGIPFIGKITEDAAVTLAAYSWGDEATSEGKTMMPVTPPADAKGVSLVLTRAEGLYDVETMGKNDVFLQVRHGDDTLLSEVGDNAGVNPTFNTVFMFPFKGRRRAKIEIRDKQRKGDRLIGVAKLDLTALLAKPRASSTPISISMRNPKGEQQGVLHGFVEFLDREVQLNAYKKI